MQGITYSVTFDVVTPESAAEGDFAETGFEKEGVQLNFDDETDAVSAAADVVEDTCGHCEASSSSIDAHTWFTSADPEVDYRTGEEARKSVHFDGVDAEFLQAVAAKLRARGLL